MDTTFGIYSEAIGYVSLWTQGTTNTMIRDYLQMSPPPPPPHTHTHTHTHTSHTTQHTHTHHTPILKVLPCKTGSNVSGICGEIMVWKWFSIFIKDGDIIVHTTYALAKPPLNLQLRCIWGNIGYGYYQWPTLGYSLWVKYIIWVNPWVRTRNHKRDHVLDNLIVRKFYITSKLNVFVCFSPLIFKFWMYMYMCFSPCQTINFDNTNYGIDFWQDIIVTNDIPWNMRYFCCHWACVEPMLFATNCHNVLTHTSRRPPSDMGVLFKPYLFALFFYRGYKANKLTS